MNKKDKFSPVKKNINFVDLEHVVLNKWNKEDTFQRLRNKNKNNDHWSFIDGPITANNPMGVHHAWGRTLKDIFQRYHAMNGKDLRYQNGFDCQGLWVEVEVEKELGFKSKRDVEEYGIEKFVKLCKERVKKYSKIQTEQSKRLGYWMDWENSYYTMEDENNYAIWGFLKKLFESKKIYKGSDVVPWSGRSGTSYSQMEIIEGRKLVAHKSVFIKFPLKDKKDEHLLVWTTTPWTLTSNVAVAINAELDYLKIQTNDNSIYYFAKENLDYLRLEKQFNDKKQWIKGIPKLKTISQIFKERGGYKILDTIKGSDLIGLEYIGPFDELLPQSQFGGFPFVNQELKNEKISSIKCHKVIDGGKDEIGNDIVVAGEGTGLVHIAPGCGAIDNKIANKLNLVAIAPLDDEAKYLDGFGWLTGKVATEKSTIDLILDDLKKKDVLLYVEKYPHIYPHCWRSGDELVYRMVDEWYINMDWRKKIKKIVDDIEWIPSWGHEREIEWLENMGDWMISKKRFWGLALPIWTFEDGSFYVVGSKKELRELAVEGWEEFKGNSPHRPWIDKVKIRHPETGLIGKRIPDVGNPWLDAGIVSYSTIKYNTDKEYWMKWFPADFVVECFPGQFRNWFYSMLAMSTVMENRAPFKTLLGHALVKDETGREMHKSWGNAIWFDDAAEKMGVDVMRWMYASQNSEHNLLFGYNIADEVRKNLITMWNTYSFFVTYANIDKFNPSRFKLDKSSLTKLDIWILAKLNELTRQAILYYEKYQIFKFMKEATTFLDDLSNWYIRRNRRRFWKQVNDVDKMSAYSTLYYVLINYCKLMSPIIPFITENIYENLFSKFSNDKNNSIHLSCFPKLEKKWTNNQIIKEIDTIISIVKMGRSARNKGNIKIRQPLSSLSLYSDNDINDIAIRNKIEILEELNIKEIKLVKSIKELVDYRIKPNFGYISNKYKDDSNSIIKHLSKCDQDELKKNFINKKKYLTNYKNINLTKDDFIIDEIAKKGFSVSVSNNIVVGISLDITDDLKQEGIVRDLIRKIQTLRKESGLQVEDRINVGIISSEYIELSLKNYKNYFMDEILAVDIKNNTEGLNFIDNVHINNTNVNIGISSVVKEKA